jgi:predicted nucleic acid binding AN1-type Zn finger protein
MLKVIKSGLLLIALLGLAIACDSGSNSADAKSEKTEEAGKEYTAAYVCPMHCEGSGSEEPGKCPVCGMDYVKNEEHKSDGHDHGEHKHDHDEHGHSHEGHSH